MYGDLVGFFKGVSFNLCLIHDCIPDFSNKNQAHSLGFVTVGDMDIQQHHTLEEELTIRVLIFQIVLTHYWLCTTQKYGELHKDSSLEITLISSSSMKGAQCKLHSAFLL
jgi:hypothetical protein